MRKIKVTRKQYNIINKLYRVGGFFTIVGLLVAYSWLISKPIEFVLIFLPYFITKGYYQRQFHSKSLKQCFLISLVVFICATSLSLSIYSSIMFSFVLGLLIAYYSYRVGLVQLKLKDYAYIEPKFNQLVEWYNNTLNKPFDVDTCTEQELLDRCKELHFSELNTKLAVEMFIKKTKQSIIADELVIEEKSVIQRKLRLKAKLNKKFEENS